MARTILIISGKGGVGKTTTAINLASAIHNYGEDVLLVDSSLTTPDVGLHLGAPVTPINLHDILAGRAKPREAVYQHSSGLKVLPGSISLQAMRKAKPGRMKNALASLKRFTNFLILDSSAGFSAETINSIHAASELIVVTNPDLPSVTNALKAVKIAESMRKPVTGVIVTRVKGSKNEMSLSSIGDMLETEILGVVPEDETVRTATFNKDILLEAYPRSRAARAYRQIAANLLGVSYEAEEVGFFERILKGLRLVR